MLIIDGEWLRLGLDGGYIITEQNLFQQLLIENMDLVCTSICYKMYTSSLHIHVYHFVPFPVYCCALHVMERIFFSSLPNKNMQIKPSTLLWHKDLLASQEQREPLKCLCSLFSMCGNICSIGTSGGFLGNLKTCMSWSASHNGLLSC